MGEKGYDDVTPPFDPSTQCFQHLRRIEMETTDNKSKPEKYYIGIDAGSVSLNSVVINSSREVVFESGYKRHFGRLDEEMYKLVRMLFRKFGESDIRSVSFTGVHGQTFGQELGTLYEFETISQVLGVLAVLPNVKSIITM